MEIPATRPSMDSATKRIIAKIMRGLTKLPIGISHAASGFLCGLHFGSNDTDLPREPKAVLVGMTYGKYEHYPYSRPRNFGFTRQSDHRSGCTGCRLRAWASGRSQRGKHRRT